MTLSAAFHTAVSGLAAGARLADLTAGNIANALTEGYGRRELGLASQTAGQGVRVLGVTRQMQPPLVQDLRLANAALGAHDREAEALRSLDAAFGRDGDTGAFAARLASLERSLIEASARPESTTRLTAAVDAAQAVVQSFAKVSQTITQIRQDADRAIARDLDALSVALDGVARLNGQIAATAARGEDASGLVDQRQKLVDDMAPLVALREVARPGGQIALFTTSGVTLLDGQRRATLGFTPTRSVTPETTLANGLVSGLSVDGQPVSTGPEGGRFGPGAISAAFALRDEGAPARQRQLDALAANLATRFADPALDPSLASGAAGLFTDAGGPVNPTQTTGLAGRLRLNPALDPQAGGAVWRLRDGLGATQPSAQTDPARLQGMASALSRPEVMTDLGARGGMSDLAAELHSLIATDRLRAEGAQSYSRAHRDILSQNLQAMGVDTDREMQLLLQIEQAYGANARVVRALDDMMRNLLEI